MYLATAANKQDKTQVLLALRRETNPHFKRFALALALGFILSRALVILSFEPVHGPYYHEMVQNQFSIAEARWNGHPNSWDKKRQAAAVLESERLKRQLSIEEWDTLPRWEFTTFPAMDLPGYGYLIAVTSGLFGTQLTSRYAFALQLLAEFLGILLYCLLIWRFMSPHLACWTGWIYVIAYVFVHPVSGQPIRDLMVIPVYSLLCWVVLEGFRVSQPKGLEFLKRIGKPQILHLAKLTAALVTVALLLWVRPIGYYFIYGLALLILFFPKKIGKLRLSALVLICFGFLAFSLPLQNFNRHYYGTKDPKFLGWGLWVSLGLVQPNDFGFVYGDRDMRRWGQERLGDPHLGLGDIRLNEEAYRYALSAIRQQPSLLLRSYGEKFKRFWKEPLSWEAYWTLKTTGDLAQEVDLEKGNFLWNKLTLYLKLIARYPIDALHRAVSIYGFFFSKLGLIGICLGLLLRKESMRTLIRERWVFLVLLSPLIYHLTQFFLYVPERRHFAQGAWPLCLGVAVFVEWMIQSKRKSKTSAPHATVA